MHKQIKELVKNAGMCVDGSGNPIWGGLNYDEKTVFLEKFATLLVDECVAQLNIDGVPAPIQSGLNLGKVAIKQHFGVE